MVPLASGGYPEVMYESPDLCLARQITEGGNFVFSVTSVLITR